MTTPRTYRRWPRWRWTHGRLSIGIDLGTWVVGVVVMNSNVGLYLGPVGIDWDFPGRAIL